MPSTSFCRARRLFLSLLGLLVVAACVSFWRSVPSVMGADGVQPLADTVEGWRLSGQSFWQHPTVLWLLPADFAVYGLCVVGGLCGVLLLFGLVPRVAAFVGWGAYLSLFHSAPVEFMGSWDVLLLETLFLAGFFAPGGVRPGERWDRSGHPAAHWLLRWLLARVLAQSVWSRLDGNYELWMGSQDGLKFGLFTDPLPSPFGMSLEGVGDGALQWMSLMWVILEGVLAVAVLCPKWVRRAAVLPLVLMFGFQWLLFNHGWMAPLGVALSVLLLDDGILRRKVADHEPGPGWVRPVAWGAAGVFALVSLLQWWAMGRTPEKIEGAWHVLYHAQPWATCNSYAAPVATSQRVWVFEGRSERGSGWHPFEWEHLPGRTDRVPAWLPLHVPRLEYAMAFAPTAGGAQSLNSTWHRVLVRRLFERAPGVLDVFAETPFDAAPYSVRIVNYAYYPAPASSSDTWQRGPDPEHPFSGEILPTDVGVR